MNAQRRGFSVVEFAVVVMILGIVLFVVDSHLQHVRDDQKAKARAAVTTKPSVEVVDTASITANNWGWMPLVSETVRIVDQNSGKDTGMRLIEFRVTDAQVLTALVNPLTCNTPGSAPNEVRWKPGDQVLVASVPGVEASGIYSSPPTIHIVVGWRPKLSPPNLVP